MLSTEECDHDGDNVETRRRRVRHFRDGRQPVIEAIAIEQVRN